MSQSDPQPAPSFRPAAPRRSVATWELTTPLHGGVAPTAALPAPAPRARAFAEPGAGWVIAFFVLLFCCQLALLVPSLATVRIVFRIASFGASLAMLIFLINRRGRSHPAIIAAIVVLAVLLFQIVHPESPGVIPSAATIGLNLAILAPLWWVGRLKFGPAGFRKIMLTLWAFQTLSAAVGLLQIKFPEKFQMNISSVMVNSQFGIEGARYFLADGTEVLRPTGLTDQPGGAAAAGIVATVFGFGILVYERNILIRLGGAASMFIGTAAIYFCQVRVALVMTGICLIVFVVAMLMRGDVRRLWWPAMIAAGMLTIATVYAFAVGGEAVTQRVGSLFQDSPTSVYYSNRGVFLDYTLNVLLPQYPMGAGMGRWGMIQYYFAPNAEMMWAEIQWTGWLFDGGVPLWIAYGLAILIALWISWRIAIDKRVGDFGVWAALICAYNVAAGAVTFSYPLFNGQGGMEFWVLNACLYTAYLAIRKVPAQRGVEIATPEARPT